jgi:hypothetical protein
MPTGLMRRGGYEQLSIAIRHPSIFACLSVSPCQSQGETIHPPVHRKPLCRSSCCWSFRVSRTIQSPEHRRLQTPFVADTIEDLAPQLGISGRSLRRTIDQFNAATRPGIFKPLELDQLSTDGLDPPKSNWALPINVPPYRAWPVSSSNCFTFGGLRCNANAQVVDRDGRHFSGLYAAGETMGIYYGRYIGATSVLRGAVFGRIAGRHAAEHMRSRREIRSAY